MTVCIAAALVVLSLGGLLAAAWHGSNIAFRSPKMLPMEIFPERYGLPFETVSFQATDGLSLKGWIIPAAQPTERAILLCHGWGDNKGDLLRYTHFLREGFNLFYFDFRQHGESSGDLSTIGCLETRDVEGALEWLKRNRPGWMKRLGTYGLSMGGSLSIWAASRHPEIKAVAIEAPFASFNEVVRQWTWNAFRLPYFPFAWSTLHVIRWRLGEDPEPYSPIHNIASIAPRPLLVVGGEEDQLMPPDIVRKVFAAAKAPKELWMIPGARHAKCEETAPEEYHRRLLGFFHDHL